MSNDVVSVPDQSKMTPSCSQWRRRYYDGSHLVKCFPANVLVSQIHLTVQQSTDY